MSEKYSKDYNQNPLNDEINIEDNVSSTIGKYNNLTNMKLFDSLSLTRKMQAQENFSQIAKNERFQGQSPMKEQHNKNEDLVQSQQQEISRLKKENLHNQLKVQELDNYKIILEDQLSQKNQFSIDKESKLQEEINKSKEDNALLKTKLQKLENDCREQDETFYQFKKLKQQELDQQKQSLLNQSENQLHREIKDLNQKFNQEKQIFQSEIQKEKEIIRVYSDEIKILLNQNQEQQQQIITLKKLEDKLKEKEHMIISIYSELDLKKDLLDKKTAECENSKQQNREMNMQMTNSQKDNFMTVQKKENIIGDFEKQINKLRKDKDNLLLIQHKYYDAEIQIQNQQNEIKKLNQVLNEKNNNLDKNNIKLLAVQSQLQKNEEENQKLQEKAHLMNQEYDLIKANYKNKQDDFQRLLQKYKDMEQDYGQYKQSEMKKSYSKDEQIDSLNNENKQQKEKLQENQVFILQQTHLIQQQQQSLANQSQKQINMNSEIKNLQDHNLQKTNEIENLSSQVNLYKPYQSQFTQQEKQLDLLLTEIERLNRLLIDYINENETLTQQKNEIQKYVGWYKEKDSEVQQLEQELQVQLQRNQSMIKLQFSCNDLDTDLKSTRMELDRHSQQVQSKNMEILNYQNRIQELENQCLHLKNDVKQISNLKMEIERNQLSLKQKDQEIEYQKDQNFEFQSLKTKFQDKLSMVTDLQAQIESLQRQNYVSQTNLY